MRFLPKALLSMLFITVAPSAIAAQHPLDLWEEVEPYPSWSAVSDEIGDFDIYAANEQFEQPLMEQQYGSQYGSQYGAGAGFESSPLMGEQGGMGMPMEEGGLLGGRPQQWSGAIPQQQWTGMAPTQQWGQQGAVGNVGLGLGLGVGVGSGLGLAGQQQFQQPLSEFGTGFGSSWNQQEALLGGLGQGQLGLGLGSSKSRLRMPKGSSSTSRMVLPTITERGDRMMNQPIQSQGVQQRLTLPLINRNKGSTTNQPIYASPIIHNQIMDQNVIRPHYITQPVIRTVNMVQPIKSHRFVDQPIVQPVITQPILRRHFIDQNVVTNQIITQPIVQPSKTHQTFVRGRLVQSPSTSKQQVENINELPQRPIINQEVGETRRAMFLPLETQDLGQKVIEQAVQQQKK